MLHIRAIHLSSHRHRFTIRQRHGRSEVGTETQTEEPEEPECYKSLASASETCSHAESVRIPPDSCRIYQKSNQILCRIHQKLHQDKAESMQNIPESQPNSMQILTETNTAPCRIHADPIRNQTKSMQNLAETNPNPCRTFQKSNQTHAESNRNQT